MSIGKDRNLLLRMCCLCLMALLVTIPCSISARHQEIPPPQSSDQIDIPAFILESKQRSSENWIKVRHLIHEYTFKFRRMRRELNKRGEVRKQSEVFEVYPSRLLPPQSRKTLGQWYILIEKNGKPVSAKRLAKERMKLGERFEKAERQAEESPASIASTTPGHSPGDWGYSSTNGKCFNLRTLEIMETCDFHSPRRERFKGRDLVVLDFRPRAGATFSECTSYMPQVEGRIWIDAQDKVVARLAIWPKGAEPGGDNSDNVINNAAYAYEQMRMEEDIWLWERIVTNSIKYPAVFLMAADYTPRTDYTVEYSEYTHFKVEIEKMEIITPEKHR